MMGWQWHQLDHTQIICTSLLTDNHSIPHHSVFTGRMLSCHPTNSVKALKAPNSVKKKIQQLARVSRSVKLCRG